MVLYELNQLREIIPKSMSAHNTTYIQEYKWCQDDDDYDGDDNDGCFYYSML